MLANTNVDSPSPRKGCQSGGKGRVPCQGPTIPPLSAVRAECVPTGPYVLALGSEFCVVAAAPVKETSSERTLESSVRLFSGPQWPTSLSDPTCQAQDPLEPFLGVTDPCLCRTRSLARRSSVDVLPPGPTPDVDLLEWAVGVRANGPVPPPPRPQTQGPLLTPKVLRTRVSARHSTVYAT